MSSNLKIFLILLLIFHLLLIITTTKRKKLSMKYVSFWIFFEIIMALLVVFPNLIFHLSNLLGFEKTSNMIFLFAFFCLFYVIFILTISISMQNTKIKLLIQEISMLKERTDNNGKKK